MNERIKELAEQAGIVNRKFSFGQWWETDLTPEQEKFAQLIILECASLFPQTFTDEQYQRRIDKSIKKHFGV